MEMDVMLRFTIIGDSEVGKSVFMKRITDGIFNPNPGTTIGVDFGTSVFNIGDHRVKINFWDTAGQEKFRSITLTKNFYSNTQCVILMYDLTNADSLDNCHRWIAEIKQNVRDDVIIVLIGNKLDAASKYPIFNTGRAVLQSQLDKFEAKYGIKSYKVSAKDGTNVDNTIRNIIKTILKIDDIPPSTDTVKLLDTEKSKKKRSCCGFF
jgi:small GTP-binding protein